MWEEIRNIHIPYGYYQIDLTETHANYQQPNPLLKLKIYLGQGPVMRNAGRDCWLCAGQ
jgi:hypothetical protein